MKVAIVQSNIHWEDKKKNIQGFEQKLNHIEAETQLVILPEMFATGFSMNPEKLAEKYPGETVAWMKQITNRYGFALAGSIIAETNGNYFNRMIFAQPTGEITYYDKRHLFRMGKEDEHYSAGVKRVIAEYEGWRIMLAVCYDIRFPVWLRNRNDYDLLILVANFPEKRRYAWNSLVVARAIENQAYVAACNRVGSDGNNITHTGDSQIVDPMGQPLAIAKPNSEEIIYATLSKDYLKSVRESFPVHLDADNFTINL